MCADKDAILAQSQQLLCLEQSAKSKLREQLREMHSDYDKKNTCGMILFFGTKLRIWAARRNSSDLLKLILEGAQLSNTRCIEIKSKSVSNKILI